MGLEPEGARAQGALVHDLRSRDRRVYTEDDFAGKDVVPQIGQPGRWPFTRGPYPTMYRWRFWTARQFAGFGTPDETNARFRYLLEHGQTGLSKAFDVPTLMGLDSDHPRSLGESAARGWRSTA